jgi:hypothetical protein
MLLIIILSLSSLKKRQVKALKKPEKERFATLLYSTTRRKSQAVARFWRAIERNRARGFQVETR